jgi:hypothetical protein
VADASLNSSTISFIVHNSPAYDSLGPKAHKMLFEKLLKYIGRIIVTVSLTALASNPPIYPATP